MTTRRAAATLTAVLALALAGCSSGTTTEVQDQTSAARTADPAACRTKAAALMTVTLTEKGSAGMNELAAKYPDRSLGIPECTGLTTAQLDTLAEQLKADLAPVLLAVAASEAASPSAR